MRVSAVAKETSKKCLWTLFWRWLRRCLSSCVQSLRNSWTVNIWKSTKFALKALCRKAEPNSCDFISVHLHIFTSIRIRYSLKWIIAATAASYESSIRIHSASETQKITRRRTIFIIETHFGGVRECVERDFWCKIQIKEISLGKKNKYQSGFESVRPYLRV